MSNNDWLGGLVGLGMAGALGYAAFKGVEHLANQQREHEHNLHRQRVAALQALQNEQSRQERQQRAAVEAHISKVNDGIDQLLQNPEAVIPVVRDCVATMDETNWKIFAGLLAKKAEQSDAAQAILYLAHTTREAVGEVVQLVAYTLDEAVSLVSDLLPTKNEIEQVGFLLALAAKAKENVRARALLGRLTAA